MEKAYLIVEHIIIDAQKFEEYRAKVGPMIAKHDFVMGWREKQASRLFGQPRLQECLANFLTQFERPYRAGPDPN